MTDLFGTVKQEGPCKTLCGRGRPCGNRHCSANPAYIPPMPKKKKQSKSFNRQPLSSRFGR